jgi:hypothetical protein
MDRIRGSDLGREVGWGRYDDWASDPRMGGRMGGPGRSVVIHISGFHPLPSIPAPLPFVSPTCSSHIPFHSVAPKQ